MALDGTESEGFRWTKKAAKAARLVADGNLTYPEIAEELQVGRRTLFRWRQADQFKARVAEYLAEIKAEVHRVGIADREKRVAAYNDLWGRMRSVIEARADHPDYKDAPGGSTGLLLKTVKGIGSGEDFEVVELFTVDTALIKEIRETAKQAAIELGQWVEKQETTPPSKIDDGIRADANRIYGTPDPA